MKIKKKIIRRNNLIAVFITLVAAILIVAIAGFFVLKPREDLIQGQVEASEVRISSKVAGRVAELRVKEGDAVQAGDTLAILDSPEVRAKLLQAQSAQSAAIAQDSKAAKGARQETINAAHAAWQKSIAGLDIAEKSYRRIQNLFEQGVVSAQKRDEADANYRAMQATEQAAHAQYQLAVNGAEPEDKLAAKALVSQAQGAIDEVEAYIDETYLISPVDGQVSGIFPQVGELVGTGAPIMNIMDKSDMWVVFNVREDKLKDLRIGQSINAYIPALDQSASFTLYYMKDRGTYAAWRATKTNGDYDLRTFEVKARPTQAIDHLHPGMSVVVK